MRSIHVHDVSRLTLVAFLALAVVVCGRVDAHDSSGDSGDSRPIRNLQPYPNDSGFMATFSLDGRIDRKNPFFKSLGTNGRTCETCHNAAEAFSITPRSIRERFERTNGRDPLFASVDGANCANAKRSDRKAHSLLLGHGLIRVAQVVPANAQFQISVVHDPYGCALVSDPQTGGLVASIYRRPLPTTNISFLSTIMWDGRETVAPLNNGDTFLANLRAGLMHQVISATTIHAEGVAPDAAQINQIVDLELGLFTAQIWDSRAGNLDARGAGGGPQALSEENYYPGINDSLGADPAGLSFTSFSMSMFSPWAAPVPAGTGDRLRDQTRARRDIAEGERLFNSAPLTISAVRGLNDNPALGKPASFQGTCTTCHDTPNVGHHSLPLPLDIGIGHTELSSFENDANISAALAEVDAPDLPVFEIRGCPSPFGAEQPVSFFTTDPGKALVTGQCGDVNRLKGPVLRGLAARAPYFHNGAAKNLLQAVNFYNQRFAMNLNDTQKKQLVAFLNSL